MTNFDNFDYKKYLIMYPDLYDGLKLDAMTTMCVCVSCDKILKSILWDHWKTFGMKEKRECFSLYEINEKGTKIDISLFDLLF